MKEIVAFLASCSSRPSWWPYPANDSQCRRTTPSNDQFHHEGREEHEGEASGVEEQAVIFSNPAPSPPDQILSTSLKRHAYCKLQGALDFGWRKKPLAFFGVAAIMRLWLLPVASFFGATCSAPMPVGTEDVR